MKAATIAQLRGRLGAATKRYEDEKRFFYEHTGKMEREAHDVLMSRNSLAWLVLDAIDVMRQYDTPLLRLARAGLQMKLDDALPGFRLKAQIDRDQMAEGNAKADAAERAGRAKKIAATSKPDDESDAG